MNDVTAAVLAGGLGTRLRSVVADRPKVLAPVAGRPFLAYLLDQLAEAGVTRCVLLVGYGAEQVREAMGEFHAGMSIVYSREPEPLGTGGALQLARLHLPTDPVLLLNGDSFCDVNLVELVEFHRSRAAAATLAIAHVENASRYGHIEMNDARRIERFAEKQPTPLPGCINAGIYALNRRLLDDIPTGRAVSLEREVLPGWVQHGEVFGFPGGGTFIDIGVPESYAEANALFARRARDHSTMASPMRAGNRL